MLTFIRDPTASLGQFDLGAVSSAPLNYLEMTPIGGSMVRDPLGARGFASRIDDETPEPTAAKFCDGTSSKCLPPARWPTNLKVRGPRRVDAGRVLLSRRVLIVEDEKPLANIIGSYLAREGFEVLLSHNGLDAVEQARSAKPDLIVLDVMLPGLDGLEVCRQIRTFTDAYVIMLTARDEEIDKVVGLSVGADDYVVKPFSPRELLARVQAMLRRPRTGGEEGANREKVSLLVIGDLIVDPDARTVTVAGESVDLTRTEFDLLAAMAGRPKAAFNRRQLIEAVWGPGWYGDEHVVDVHVGHLRRKLGDDAENPHLIRTVRGVGYGMGSG